MKVKELARLLNGEVNGEEDREITGVAGLENAGPHELAFAEGERALRGAKRFHAGCILVPRGTTLVGHTLIIVSHPKVALIRAAEALIPPQSSPPDIDATAVVDSTAVLASNVGVGAHSVVAEDVRVGTRTFIGPGVAIGRGVTIGSECVIHPCVSIYPNVRIGNRVVIHSGAVIGADGFGYVFADGRHQKFPQLGQVIVEDDVEIGGNTTIDRGSLGNTVIGEGSKIDNLVQIAHNVRIGRHCVIAALTGISGSVEIGNYVVIGGQVGIGDKARIEDQAVIGAQAGIPTGKVVRRGNRMWGTPARPMSEFKKTYAHMKNLPSLAEKVRKLSQRAPVKAKKG